VRVELAMERTSSIGELVASREIPPAGLDFDAADEELEKMLPEYEGNEMPDLVDGEVLGVPVGATPLFRLCCSGHGERPLDCEQIRGAHPDEWRREKPNGATPLHALCANPNLTLDAFSAAAERAPAEAWGKCNQQGANPLHRLFGNEKLTVQMLELIAFKVPPTAWHQQNQFGTPAHRLCGNAAAVSAPMLSIARRYAPPQTWKTKNKPGLKGKGGGLTPLDILLGRKMADRRTPDLVREAAALMDGGAGAAGAAGGSPSLRRPIRSLSGGNISGGSSPRRSASAGSGSGSGSAAGPTADWKLKAAKHFFAMGAAGGVGLSTALPPPVITRHPDDVACVRLRCRIGENTKGDFMNGCVKGTVFAEAKWAVAKELDKFKDSRRTVKDSTGELGAYPSLL
jgi:hypothetical protein